MVRRSVVGQRLFWACCGLAARVPLAGANKCVNLMAGRWRDFQRLVLLIEFLK